MTLGHIYAEEISTMTEIAAELVRQGVTFEVFWVESRKQWDIQLAGGY